jgi:hypothetical protein
MLDVISATEADPFGGLTSMLAQLRGDPFPSGGVECIGDACRPVDQFGNPVDVDIDNGPGYWWTRISLSFLGLAAILTVASMRLVVPAGMRGIRRRRSRASSATEAATDSAPAIEELRGEEP